MRAILALADGTVFEGKAFGARGECVGEVVFNTAMTGYQEVLTDPSYKGQIVCMTYPLIGNYGLNPEDIESHRPFVEGFIVREACPFPSNYRGRESVDAYLKRWKITGIQGIDTRALTKHLRDHGAQQGVISTEDTKADRLAARAAADPGLLARDLVKEVTCPEPYTWTEPAWQWEPPTRARPRGGQPPVKDQLSLFGPSATQGPRHRVVAVDCGIKWGILRQLVSAGCQVEVVPAFTGADEILGRDPDGIVLSNGPGDPEGVPYLVDTARRLIGQRPLFGICLGHQILGLALGGRTYKLKFGHHGANHPVRHLSTGRVEITTQNHGFAVDVDSIPGRSVELSHVNLNDGTAEGMRHKTLPCFSVQYHPEASPGPHDSAYLFAHFINLMEQYRG